MRESIYTIPVNEVFVPENGCPICRMRDMLEERCLEYIMGAAMMEPDVRMETNRLGFCTDHYFTMLKRRNRLSIGLMLESHLEEVEKNILKGDFTALFDKQSRAKKAKALGESCYVCSKIDWAMERMLSTVFRLYTNEKAFREAFRECDYLCLPHYELLVSRGANEIPKKSFSDFHKDALKLTTDHLAELRGDVSHFCKMFDYRNSGEDADWGNSKDAVERAVEYLTTRRPK